MAAMTVSTDNGIGAANSSLYTFISTKLILWLVPTIPSVRRTRLGSSLRDGGTDSRDVVVAGRPHRGAKLSGRCGLFPGVGKAAVMCFVAAARNSPNVHVFGAAAPPRDRRNMIREEANRSAVARCAPCSGPVGVGSEESSMGLGVVGWLAAGLGVVGWA